MARYRDGELSLVCGRRRIFNAYGRGSPEPWSSMAKRSTSGAGMGDLGRQYWQT